MQQLINKLPIDIIINHIIPYTYLPQSHNILRDIRSYVADYMFIDNIYMTQYNEYILLHDLFIFCRKNVNPTYGIENRFETILRRHFSIVNKKYEELINIVIINFDRNKDINTYRKMRFIWGLLKPNERTNFINNFILLDDDF